MELLYNCDDLHIVIKCLKKAGNSDEVFREEPLFQSSSERSEDDLSLQDTEAGSAAGGWTLPGWVSDSVLSRLRHGPCSFQS